MGGWFDDLVDNADVFENHYNTFVDDGAALGAHLLVQIDITVADEMTFKKTICGSFIGCVSCNCLFYF